MSASLSPAIQTDQLTKDFRVGFWRPRPYRALDGSDPRRPAWRGLRLPRSQRRRQDDHAQAADAADLPDRGQAAILGRPVGDLDVRRRIGYLPENPYFYDYLTAEELLTTSRASSATAAAERRQRVARCSTRSDSARSGGCSCASFRRAWCSASGSPRRWSTTRSALPRRADVGPGPARAPRRPRADPSAARSGRGPSSSARTSCQMPRRCAAAWRSLAGGRLAAAGRLSDMRRLRPARLGAGGVGCRCRAAAPVRAARGPDHDDRRDRFDAGAAERCAVAAPGQRADRGRRQIVSLNPLHATLEDFFVQKVQAAGSARDGAIA